MPVQHSGEKSCSDSVLELVFGREPVEVVLKAEHSAVWRSRSKRGQCPTLDLFLQSLDGGQGGHEQGAEGQVPNSNTVEQVQLAAFMLVMQPCINATLSTAVPECRSISQSRTD